MISCYRKILPMSTSRRFSSSCFDQGSCSTRVSDRSRHWVKSHWCLRATSSICQLLSIDLIQGLPEYPSCSGMSPMDLRALLVSPPQGEDARLAASPSQYDALPPSSDVVQNISDYCTCEFCVAPGARQHTRTFFEPFTSDQFQDHCQLSYIYFE